MFHLTKHCVPIAFSNLGSQNELRVGKFIVSLDSIQHEQSYLKLG